MNYITALIISIVGFSAIMSSCSKILPLAPKSSEVLAEPLNSLSEAQMLNHIIGDEEFAKIFSEEEGLGPIFVQTSCENCHVGDGKGNPFNNLIRYGQYDSNGIWDPVLDQGGPQLQNRAIASYTPEELPDGVKNSQFIAPNVTGLGYLAAVKDEDILAMADPNDTDGDGISGTINYIEKPSYLEPDQRYHQLQSNGKYIGRFGRKSAAIDLLHQTVNAYKQDMGITSEFDMEDPVNFMISVMGDDNVADPEVSNSTINKVVFYLQTLEAPRRRNPESSEVLVGELVFEKVGCDKCHVSKLKTGPSEITALNEVEFYPYTDMLMHDMGSKLDDQYTEGVALTSEWRTMPLWGLGLQKDVQGGQMYLMHDGRAQSYKEAIELHGGEAQDSRDKYDLLTEAEKIQLEVFLESL